MAALILDASVLIGLLDTADAHHEPVVRDVDEADTAGAALLAPTKLHTY